VNVAPQREQAPEFIWCSTIDAFAALAGDTVFDTSFDDLIDTIEPHQIRLLHSWNPCLNCGCRCASVGASSALKLILQLRGSSIWCSSDSPNPRRRPSHCFVTHNNGASGVMSFRQIAVGRRLFGIVPSRLHNGTIRAFMYRHRNISTAYITFSSAMVELG
jgi:hypothetical protein